MTKNSIESIPNQLKVGSIKGRKVIADFTGGIITSDGGIILMAELDKKLKITEKFAKCFQDYRHGSYTDYPLHLLLAQRIYGIILGYEDVNGHRRCAFSEHETIRHDPALQIALQKLCHLNSKEGI